ncbi:uncharacterized protein LOC132169285 [Corylus avellana]|uniref:uncharacterized protein LOC132169285 n=1 Tax=Corylus avellana TaxID=13451 RepID=UPI00286D50E8|nr:uncharacterized protein LOC132169285 [Corylus avellana]
MAISFYEEDARRVIFPHDDALVVTLTVANHKSHRVLVDNGSSADILYWPVFKQMGVDRDRIQPFDSPLVGFAREQVQPMGLISLSVTVGTGPRQSTTMVDFLVIDRPSTYNAIIGRPSLNKLKAVTSTYHLMMKFPTEEGVGEVKGDQAAARKCYNISLKKSDLATLTVGVVGSRSQDPLKGEPVEPLEDVELGEGKVVKVGTQLASGIRDALITFLQRNMEVFAWTHEDMPGISPDDIHHQLNVDPSMKPVRQKRRKFSFERNMAIAEEVEKLLKALFIKEVYYPDRLASVVLVKKFNGKWRICVDFTDLNKACPKASFPLPHIDALVDSTAGYGMTDRGLYCYKVTPFGLKNAGATY